VIELVEGVVAVHLLGAATGASSAASSRRGRRSRRLVQRSASCPGAAEDRPLDEDLRRVQGPSAGAFHDVGASA
jgi:histidine ammonia-lyase